MNTSEDTPTKAPRAAERIFEAACELFYREGTRAVGVDEIVTKAGATKPTLYRSFESKDELVAAYLRGQADYFWNLFNTSLEAHPGDPRQQILTFLEGMGRRASSHGYRGCGLTNAVIEYPAPDHPGRRVSVAHKAELRAKLRAMAAEMGAQSPDELGDHLLLLIEGAYASSQAFGEGGPAGGVHKAAAVLIDAAVA
jgi:AcrR family transcriptional regulator